MIERKPSCARRINWLWPGVVLVFCTLTGTGYAKAMPLPGAPDCQIFPTSSHWNTDISKLPTDRKSGTYIRAIGAEDYLHPDFGSGTWGGGPIGIPFNVVGGGRPKMTYNFEYADESDPGPYPLPKRPKVEFGSDHHLLTVDSSTCKLYELYNVTKKGRGRSAGSGAIFDLDANRMRPRGWTSADAAGLAILPGLARYDEVAAGSIEHALRFTVERTRRAFQYPARHFASDSSDPNLPPMGLRVRLKRSFDTSGFPEQVQVVLNALKRYGMILADNGSNWYISGAPNSGWDNDDLHSLQQVKGSDLEVVDTRSLPKPGL